WFLRHALYSTIRCDPLYPLIFLPIPYLLSGYGIIADGLRQQFQSKEILLSQNLILVTEKENLKWRLVDGGKVYILKTDNNKLTVSKIQALDANNIWPGVPERFSGNGSEGGDWVSIIHVKT
ncbi:hypothetical protein, partial [Nostoc sp.]|uniref:hypothetical protein n=1 Tax=Nostoc sp. TaxID=1180 RepID=UPI002FF966E9